MVFFALVDPDDLREITWADLELSRMAGYTIGFFMFWACTFASSLFTWMLLRTPIQGRRRGQPLDGNEPVSPNASSALPEHGGGSKRVP
jgi:hypothetical protein